MQYLLCGLALGLAACSGSSGMASGSGGNANTSGGSAGSASAGTSSGGSSGGSSHGGSASSGAAGASGSVAAGGSTFVSTLINAPTQLRGDVGIDQSSGDDVSFLVRAYLEFGSRRGAWDGCTRNTLGDCWYYDCPAGSNALGSPNVPPVYYDPGSVTIASGANMFAGSIDTSTGMYDGRANQQLWPLAGGVVTFTVGGSSVVPAFTMQIQAPPMARLVSINGEAMPTSLTRSQGAAVVWDAKGPGSVFFAVFQYMGTRPAAICVFDAAQNQGTLPAAVLEKLDPGTKYYLDFRGDSRAEVMAGDFDISGTAYSFGVDFASTMTSAIELK